MDGFDSAIPGSLGKKMSADELTSRIRRIYAAVEASQEYCVGRLTGTVVSTPHIYGVHQDFSGDLSPEEMSNTAHTTIHNIANLRDHLRGWTRRNGKDVAKLVATFDGSLSLRIIQDLSNNDKHGYPPRDGGHAGMLPRIEDIGRVMKLSPGASAGSAIMMVMGARGQPIISGSGSARVVVTGEVVDKDGKIIGDLFDIEQQAIQAWENLLADFGVFVANYSS